MEFATAKRSKSRKKRGHLKKRRREQIKFEVKPEKRRRVGIELSNIFAAKERFINGTMQASSFWQNYTAAQEWQKSHSITWWKTRCIALEHENQILRDKLRSWTYQEGQSCSPHLERTKAYNDEDVDAESGAVSVEEGDNFEFHVNEDMMSFLEQSIRHKIELKKERESESLDTNEKEEEVTSIQGGATWMRARNNSAKLLYGEASATVLAMETALQATVDRHKDKAKPRYWPIIPLKP